AEIADHSEPEKIQWPRPSASDAPEPGVLVLRVEGPAAIEIQHLSGVVLERVNRFFGWRAVGALRLRQAPLTRRKQTPQRPVDNDAAARVAAHLGEITDEKLRAAPRQPRGSPAPAEKCPWPTCSCRVRSAMRSRARRMLRSPSSNMPR